MTVSSSRSLVGEGAVLSPSPAGFRLHEGYSRFRVAVQKPRKWCARRPVRAKPSAILRLCIHFPVPAVEQLRLRHEPAVMVQRSAGVAIPGQFIRPTCDTQLELRERVRRQFKILIHSLWAATCLKPQE
jgi:hypothetical protein